MEGSKCRGVGGIEYGNLLEKEFIPGCIQKYGATRQWVFMQDNAAPHKTKANMKILDDHGVKVL